MIRCGFHLFWATFHSYPVLKFYKKKKKLPGSFEIYWNLLKIPWYVLNNLFDIKKEKKYAKLKLDY